MKLLNLIQTVVADIEIKLNPNFNHNELLKAIVNIFCIAIIVSGIVYGAYMIAQSVSEESPSRRRTGIEVIIFSLLIGGSLVAFLNMVIL